MYTRMLLVSTIKRGEIEKEEGKNCFKEGKGFVAHLPIMLLAPRLPALFKPQLSQLKEREQNM